MNHTFVGEELAVKQALRVCCNQTKERSPRPLGSRQTTKEVLVPRVGPGMEEQRVSAALSLVKQSFTRKKNM